MNERSIPEIILSEHPDSWEAEQIRHRQTADIVKPDRAIDWYPTVDDLLAWLSGRGYGWSAQKWYMGAKVTVVYIETGVEWSYSTPAHPTLLEALQNAVRAIDAQEQT